MSELPAAVRRYLDVSREAAGAPFHTTQVSISFGERIDGAALRAAWDAVAADEPGLRRTFAGNDSVTIPTGPVCAWQEWNWEESPPADLGLAWQELLDADLAAPIATADAAPFRVTLITLPNGAGHALWSFHAALLDEESVTATLQRWLVAYDHARMGEPIPAFAHPADESAAPPSANLEGLSAPSPLLVLPLPAADAPAGIRRALTHTYERPERAAFAAAADTLGVNLRSLFGATWSFVLARALAAGETLLTEMWRPDGIGRRELPVATRRPVETHATAADLIRAFDEPFAAVDLAAAAAALGVSPSALEPPAAFLWRDLTLTDQLQLALPRWMAADAQILARTAPPVALRVVASDRPEVGLHYDPRTLSDEAARTLFAAFRGTLDAFVADPALALDGFPLPGRAAEVVAPDVPTAFRSLVAQGAHELFADAAADTPDAIAVEAGEEAITFGQLNATANQIARLLRKRGLQAGGRVGLAASRSPRWVAALLGTLKAGGTVVPLPAGAAPSGFDGWIVDALGEAEKPAGAGIQLEADAGALGNEKSRGPQSETRPEDAAVAWPDEAGRAPISHSALCGSLRSLAGALELTPHERVLQFAPTDTFAAIEETLAALLSGATLVLPADDRWSTRTAFQEFVGDRRITLLSVPTPFWSQWTHFLTELSLQTPPTLRLAVTTGVLPPPNATAAWRRVAGSTRWLHRSTGRDAGPGLIGETSGDDAFAAAALGMPAPGSVARIVDRHGQPLPIGLPGEVEIAVSAEPETFRAAEVAAFASADGMFYARTPLQLLAAGPAGLPLREAIRHAAATHPGVMEAYVETRLIAARQEWCLWIVPMDSERGEPRDFREWLRERLPSVPRRIRALPRFPLDAAGNLDVGALPEPTLEEPPAAAPKKGTPEEERLRATIARALGRQIALDESIADGRTKAQVAQRLLEAVAHEEPRVELADFTAPFSVRSLLRNVRGRRTTNESAWNPLHPLRASGKLPPFILVHDFDGAARSLEALVAHLGANQPCYVLTARGLAEPHAHPATVEEMARTYVEALRVFDPNGPYRLIGSGFGGLVAFEMARQIAAAGGRIALLAALGSEPPHSSSPRAFLAGGWKRALPNLFGRKADEDATRRRRGQETPVFLANREAARRYTIGDRYADPLHVFVPEADFPAYATVQAGWSAVAEDAHFYQVPCSAMELMDEPAVEAVARALGKLAKSEDLADDLEE